MRFRFWTICQLNVCLFKSLCSTWWWWRTCWKTFYWESTSFWWATRWVQNTVTSALVKIPDPMWKRSYETSSLHPDVTFQLLPLTAHCGHEEACSTSSGTVCAPSQVLMGRVKGRREEEEGVKVDMLYWQPRGGCPWVIFCINVCVRAHVRETEWAKLFANLSAWPCMGEAETLGAVTAAYWTSDRLCSHPGEASSVGSQWESQRTTPVRT